MSDSNPVNQEVEQFNKQKLKKTNTQEKNHLPTKEEIDAEKKAMKEGDELKRAREAAAHDTAAFERNLALKAIENLNK